MPLRRAVKLIDIAKEEERREFLYRFWLVRYPHYDENNYESFEEFCDKCNPEAIERDTRSKEEIMEEILNVKEGR